MLGAVLLTRDVMPRRLSDVPNVRKKAIPSMKKRSPSRCTLLPGGRVTVMILSVSVVVCVVFPLMLGTGTPYMSMDLARLWMVTGQSMSVPLVIASDVSL